VVLVAGGSSTGLGQDRYLSMDYLGVWIGWEEMRLREKVRITQELLGLLGRSRDYLA
jgi:hypothetical protein